MTFVAQPYERFVDDLLTALTGGVIREEKRFEGLEASHILTTPGADPFSVRVFGQRNERFTLFDPVTDYRYDAEQGTIVWRAEGRLPDDRSFFYVNYQVEEAVRRLTDRNPGSVTTTLAEAFAREFAVLHQQMEAIYQSAFVDLASDSALDHVVALLGLTRRDAKFASGEVFFKRTTPAPGDIAIPSGTLVSTIDGVTFETTDRRTLRRGQLSVVVPIRAVAEGVGGKVEPATIQLVLRPIFGVETVVNERATFFARVKETDEELRRRLKATLERSGKSTVEAIKYSLIEDIAEITDTNIQISERAAEPGYVDVKLGLETAGDADLVRRIEESIFYARPAGVRVLHNLTTASKGDDTRRAEAGLNREDALADFAAQVDPPDAIHLDANLLASLPEGLMPLRAEVLLRLTEPNLSVAQKERVTEEVSSAIIAFIESLPMGAPLMYNKLLGRIVQPEAVADAALLVGLAQDGPAYKGNLSTSNRKATIDTYGIYVGLMDEIVMVDVVVRVEVKAEANGTGRNGTGSAPNASANLNPEVQLAIQRAVAESPRLVRKEDVIAAVRPVVEKANFQLIEGNAVLLNAFYEESGRLLNDTAEVTLLEHESVRVRNVTVQPRGILDV
jgi:hypothetical protein